MMKKQIKKLQLKKSAVVKLSDLSQIKGRGENGRTESSCWLPCIAQCFSFDPNCV